MNYYVTPKDYETAKRNGISEKRVYARVYMHGWNIDRAITEPVRKQTRRMEWLQVSRENNISDNLFYARVNELGWTEEKAATKKPLTSKEVSLHATSQRNRQFPDWVYENLKKRNIKTTTFFTRVKRLGWDIEKACTTQPKKRNEYRTSKQKEMVK